MNKNIPHQSIKLREVVIMKYNKIFRTLALIVILSLLVIAIPVTPVLAASATLKPTSGEIGDDIDITGSGYDPGDKVYIYFSSEEANKDDYIDDDLDVWEEVATTYAGDSGDTDEGDIDTSFDVPSELTDGSDDEDVHGGDYFVYTTETDEGKILTKDTFTVTGITISPTEGPVGTEVDIDGVGFDDREDIDIEYDGVDIDIASGDDETDSKGEFELTVIIPESTAGDHTITAKVHGDEAEADFTVEPKITISPTSGEIGDEVTINGTGFGNKKDVDISLDNTDVTTSPASPETDSDGSFEVTFDVPAIAGGIYDVEAEDTSNNKDTDVFTIICNATLIPQTGHVGTEITVSGTGFLPGGTATIKYDGTEETTASIGTDGAFEATFNAPVSIHGAHTVNVSDGTNTKDLTFTMESAPPSTVYPQLPLMDNKLRGWKFDWCGDADDPAIEVTDDSPPITYNLEVASDIDFTTIVLDVEGLTTSEHTVTIKEEKELLTPSTKEAPYYWRVKAIDAASNETEWTSIRTFYTGFTWPDWIIYLWFGLGIVAAGILGFWLGRRTTYY